MESNTSAAAPVNRCVLPLWPALASDREMIRLLRFRSIPIRVLTSRVRVSISIARPLSWRDVARGSALCRLWPGCERGCPRIRRRSTSPFYDERSGAQPESLPTDWVGGAFVSQHGSWNTMPVGHNVVLFPSAQLSRQCHALTRTRRLIHSRAQHRCPAL
jgi:hypothetical protein